MSMDQNCTTGDSCCRTAEETIDEDQLRHEQAEEGDYAGTSERLKKGH